MWLWEGDTTVWLLTASPWFRNSAIQALLSALNLCYIAREPRQVPWCFYLALLQQPAELRLEHEAVDMEGPFKPLQTSFDGADGSVAGMA